MRRDQIRALLLVLTSVAITYGHTSVPQNSNDLAGTSWQLIKLQGPDETTMVPGDKSKYTITFGSDGRVTARVDCNTASSTWKSSGADQLQFGSWSRTSAKCSPGSLHDKIVREGGAIHTYTIKSGHLFLSGKAGGGWYELERLSSSKRHP